MTKEKRLTAGILKFLEDKKREDEEKAEQARRKKQELVARRDPKEQRKIEKSLKVIKSSKKYFSGDKALDENNTLESEQPDEDDYGYTSTISDHFHKKLMEKYQKLPEDKKFANSGKHKAMSKEEIQSTKDRVKNALASKDDDHQPHFRQGRQERLSKIKSEKNKVFGPGNAALKAALPLDKKNGIKPKPKLKAAPIVDFQELLKLAEQKQHEEIIIDVPTKKEPERLLTSKEKREQEELEASRRAKMKPNRIPKLGAIPKIGDASKHDKNNNEGSMRRPSLPAPISNGASKSLPVTMQRQTFSNTEKLKRSAPPTALNSSSSKLRDALEPKQNGSLRPSPLNPKVPSSSKAGTSSSSVVKPREAPSKSINGQRPAVSAANSKMRPGTSSREPERTRDFPPKDLMRTREFPPRDLKRSREFPPKDMMRSREFPPRDPKRLKQPLTANKRKLAPNFHPETISQFVVNFQAELKTKTANMIQRWTTLSTMVMLKKIIQVKLRRFLATTSPGWWSKPDAVDPVN